MNKMRWVAIAIAFLVGMRPLLVQAHVKWFSAFSFADQPRTFAALLAPLALGLMAFAAVILALLVWLDRDIAKRGLLARAEAWLNAHKQHSTLVMRIAMGGTLLLNWQADALLAPEFKESALGGLGPWLGWAQFVLALLLLLPATTPFAGAGLLLLYVAGIVQFGFFHMLDYVHLAGTAVYLLLSNVQSLRLRALRLPMLYATVGFSLCWLAMEKQIYPQWGRLVLGANPQLSLGLDAGFFLTSASFVEFGLGYLLIICLLQRPMSLLITLVFISTTLVFGKTEVIGHTPLHAALIVFLLNGPGTVYRAPIMLHERLPLRMAFAATNFVLLYLLMGALYVAGAQAEYRAHLGLVPHRIVAVGAAPTLALALTGDMLHIKTGNGFVGHAHVYVNGAHVGSTDEAQFTLGASDARGPRRVTVALHDAGHQLLLVNGAPIAQDVIW